MLKSILEPERKKETEIETFCLNISHAIVFLRFVDLFTSLMK